MALASSGNDIGSITLIPREKLREIGWTERRLFQGKRGKPCTYCAVGKGTTMDHVFAETLFDPVPEDALTVPACDPCNQKKAIGDEELHVVTAMSPDTMPAPGDEVHLLEIARAIQRNQSPLGRAAWQAMQVRRQVDPFRRGRPVAVPHDTTALYDTLEMSVRGLFFKVHGHVLPALCPVTVVPLSQAEAPSWLHAILSDPGHHMGQRGNMDVQWVMSSTNLYGKHTVLCVLLFRRGVFYLAGTSAFGQGDDATPAEFRLPPRPRGRIRHHNHIAMPMRDSITGQFSLAREKRKPT